jgi:hypothetical protein
LGKFVSIQYIREAEDIKDVQYDNRENQLKDKQLFIGFMTKQQITKLLNDGDVDPRKVAEFYEAVRQFYEIATAESLAKLPLDDELLLHARFVAKTVLILPHSNAGEERVFSMIRKNKTAFCGSLAVNGTLSSLMTIKLANFHQFEPPVEVLTSAKKATRNYNLLHKKS